MSFLSESIFDVAKDDIKKLDAYLNREESSDESDTSLDEVEDIEEITSPKCELNAQSNINIEFNDITPYNEQVQAIVSNISTVNLNTVLMLNAAQQNLLIQGIMKYQILLKNCDEHLNRIKIMKIELSNKKKDKTSSWFRCGVPYFKDITLRHYCPSNSDVRKKVQNGEMALIDLPACRFWLSHEKQILKKAVCVQSKQIRIRKIQEKSQNQEVANEWKNKPPEQCVFPISDKNVLIDWLKISIHDLRSRHTDEACKAMWYQHLHPHLNDKPYGPRESQRLKEIAAKHNYQNWDAIAKELGTNRSGYHCCLFTRIHQQKDHNKKALKWTPDEDNKLIKLIEKYKIGNFIPWGRLAYAFQNRDKQQIYNRYHASLRKELKKGQFTEQEDLMLLSLAKTFGDDIRKISTFFEGRSNTQVRIRYTSLILNKNKYQQWTEEEDKKIIDFVKENYKPKESISWTQLEKIMDNPYRNRTSIRHRWTTIKNYLNESFEGDLSRIPRPQKKRKSRQVKQADLDTVLMKLNDGNIKIDDLTNITEEVLSEGTGSTYIDKFQHFFIREFAKIRIDQPITVLEVDIFNILFLISVLNGTVNTEAVYNKKYKNSYSEKNEIKIIKSLRGAIEGLRTHSNETVFNLLRCSRLSIGESFIEEPQTINLIIPKCFISIDDFNHIFAVVKPFLKYVIWKDSELDQFYHKPKGRFERNLKSQVLQDSQALNTLEKTIVTSATSIKCEQFLDSSTGRNNKSARVTEIFKIRYMALLNFKSMESIVKNLVKLSGQLKNEYTPEKEKKIVQRLNIGRPRKKLPGGRFKYKKEVENNNKEDVSEPSSSNQIQHKSVKEELLENSQSEMEDDAPIKPILKKIKVQ